MVADSSPSVRVLRRGPVPPNVCPLVLVLIPQSLFARPCLRDVQARAHEDTRCHAVPDCLAVAKRFGTKAGLAASRSLHVFPRRPSRV